MITSFDFLQQVVACHWGGGYLLLRVRIVGFVASLSPPPYGSVNLSSLPKGVTLLDQRTIQRSQTSSPGTPTTNTVYFLWADGVLPLPDNSNYYELITSPGAQPAFSPFITPFDYGNQFSVVLSGGFDFPSLAAANAAVPRANLFGSTEALPIWTSPTSDFFNFPTSFSAHSLSVTLPPSPSATTTVDVEYLFGVPTTLNQLSIPVSVPSNSSTDGWASIFVSKKPAQGIAGLSGPAAQSVYIPSVTASHTYHINSVVKQGANAISVDGTPGFTPGLLPTAPPSP